MGNHISHYIASSPLILKESSLIEPNFKDQTQVALNFSWK